MIEPANKGFADLGLTECGHTLTSFRPVNLPDFHPAIFNFLRICAASNRSMAAHLIRLYVDALHDAPKARMPKDAAKA